MTDMQAKLRPGLDAEESIGKLIDRRSREEAYAEQERVEEGWAQTVRTYNLRAAVERRQQWIAYHRSMHQLLSSLAAEHKEKACSLLDEAGRA